MDPLVLIIILLVALWIGGVGFHVGGGLVHLLLVIALVVLVVRVVQLTRKD